MTTYARAGVKGGGGYATASDFATAKQLSTYTTTSTHYAGHYDTGTNIYNMQSQMYWDLSAAGIPAGATINSAYIRQYLDFPSGVNAGYLYFCRDPWGAPSGWTAADMEVETTLDNYAYYARDYIGSSSADGNYDFVFSASGLTYLKAILDTSTELEMTLTHSCYATGINPGTNKLYATITSAGVLYVDYTVPVYESGPIMMGCNI